MRDVLEEEVLHALGQPNARHRPGKVPGRTEVTYNTGRRSLLVVYKRVPEGILVIDAMWE